MSSGHGSPSGSSSGSSSSRSSASNKRRKTISMAEEAEEEFVQEVTEAMAVVIEPLGKSIAKLTAATVQRAIYTEEPQWFSKWRTTEEANRNKEEANRNKEAAKRRRKESQRWEALFKVLQSFKTPDLKEMEALIFEGDQDEEPAEEQEAAEEENDYSEWYVKDLQAELTKRNIKHKGLQRPALIKLLEEDDAESEERD